VVSSWAEDALWLAPHICDRLRQMVPDLRAVEALDALTGETEPRQDPAAVVLLDALRPPGSDPLQTRAIVELDWLVVLVVRSVARDGDRSRRILGPLVSQTVRALQGWIPPDSYRAFTWRQAPRPDYGKTSTLFPLRFTIQTLAA